jgi:hypothetical protein
MNYPPSEPRPKKDKAFLGRTVVVIGVLASVASIVAVAWTILHRDDKSGGSRNDRNVVGDYQNQALATCEQVHTVLTTEHNEVFIFDPPDRPTSPNDLIRVNKDLLVPVLESNLSRAKISFDELNKRPVPAELDTQHSAAVTAQNDWYASFEQFIKTVREKLPRNARLTTLMELGTLTGSLEANTRLNSAMTTLAGKNCQATG